MPKRVTVVIDDDLLKRLRYIQSRELVKTESSVSLSSVINDTLRKSFSK